VSRAGHVLSVLAILVTLAGCGGAAVGPVIASHTAAAGMGTETIRAVNAAPGATRVTIEASGVFSDEGTLAVPIGDPRTITFTFTRGNLVVLNATGPTSGPLRLDRTTCAVSRALAGTYRILPGDSTGSYAGATGHGAYTLGSGGTAPKTAAGGCRAGGQTAPDGPLSAILFRGLLVLNTAN